MNADEGSSPFTDVSVTRWSYESIMYAVVQGFMNGVGDGRFSPKGTLNRAMVVTVLFRMEGEPETEYADSFSDIPDGKWYSLPVIWAGNNGIVNGYEDGTFKPLGNITREQLAAMLFRYTEFMKYKEI